MSSSPEITKIVITGGPRAGKSTAMSWIQNAFTQQGYTVLFVPETATELITGGAGSEAEAREDIEISLAALERRAPKLEARSSPFRQSILGHN